MGDEKSYRRLGGYILASICPQAEDTIYRTQNAAPFSVYNDTIFFSLRTLVRKLSPP